MWSRRYGSAAAVAPPAPAPALRPANAFGSSLPDVVARAGWEGAWQEGVTPWETRAGHRLLRHLEAPHFGGPLPRGPILAPGVGSGRDAVELAKCFCVGGDAGAAAPFVEGLDLAPTALARAEALVAADPEAAALARAGALRFTQGDFFLRPATRPRFGVVFDYTFLSALPPGEAHARWAEACARLLAPGGEVVCIIFPVDDFAGGPPFAMRPESARELLLPLGFREKTLVPLPRELSHTQRAGREFLGRYVKENSFPLAASRRGEAVVAL